MFDFEKINNLSEKELYDRLKEIENTYNGDNKAFKNLIKFKIKEW